MSTDDDIFLESCQADISIYIYICRQTWLEHHSKDDLIPFRTENIFILLIVKSISKDILYEMIYKYSSYGFVSFKPCPSLNVEEIINSTKTRFVQYNTNIMHMVRALISSVEFIYQLFYQIPCVRWRHQMETFSALLALCTGNSPVTGEFPSQRPVMRSFEVFFNLHLDRCLSK